MNYFGGMSIPAFLGSMKKLRYLNLSGACFHGEVPHQTGNLSRLHYLDLSRTSFLEPSSSWECGLQIKNGQWLAHVSSLKYLNLDAVSIWREANWFQSLNMLPSLTELHLSYCRISTLPSVSLVNFTSLRVLDLSRNRINSTTPLWLFEMINLRYLDLSNNHFQDPVPDAIGNLTSLEVLRLSPNTDNDWSFDSLGEIKIPANLGNLCMLNELDLSWNRYPHKFHDLEEIFSGCTSDSLETLAWSSSKLRGHLPDWLGKLKNLKNLDFSHNSFYGPLPVSHLSSSLQQIRLSGNRLNSTLPESLGQLQHLVHLDLKDNKLEGMLTVTHFARLIRLEYLDLSSNKLSLKVGSDWSPPPLTYISLSSCMIGSAFPTWLQKLKNVSYIHFSTAGISDVMPEWFWNFSMVVVNINLAYNEIRGNLPNSLEHLKKLNYLHLDHNRFEGTLPLFPSGLKTLSLSYNSFSGIIPPNLGDKMPFLSDLYASTNNISGSLPKSMCKLKRLRTLSFTRNHLSGEIPNCWDHSPELYEFNLANNRLSGTIPMSIGSLPSLSAVRLHDNNLSGELPLSLKNCTRLRLLLLGWNRFSGFIPAWIGDLQELELLHLRSNMFDGNIPQELGTLSLLKIMDLANNNLSGIIPHSFGNLSGIKFARAYDWIDSYFSENDIQLNFRGREDTYQIFYSALAIIDLANNSLSGEIPDEITSLFGLKSLNLSRNHLTGKIPDKISMLRQLESLGLSFNNLSGAIPARMSVLSFLNHLNLSFNSLSGQIPSGGQLQALPDPSIYIGNHDLCGSPLNVKCHDGSGENKDGEVPYNNENESEMVWFYTSMGPGFAVGFWAACGALLLNRKWRIGYFRFVDNTIDRLHVWYALNAARIRSC